MWRIHESTTYQWIDTQSLIFEAGLNPTADSVGSKTKLHSQVKLNFCQDGFSPYILGEDLKLLVFYLLKKK